jgi:hypothetical protein
MKTPVLFLTGSESPSEYRRSIDLTDAALDNSAVHILEGQGRGATATAPALLAAEISGFVGV